MTRIRFGRRHLPRLLLAGWLWSCVALAALAEQSVHPEQANKPQAAEVVYRGGTVITMDASQPRASALAIADGRVLALGSTAEIAKYIGAETEVRELEGHTVVPGFIDAHSHLMFQGMALSRFTDLSSAPVGDLDSIDELLSRLKERAADTPEGEWVVGFAYDDTLLPEMRHPTRAELDSVSSRHPVWIAHVSGHMGVANSLALAAGGIDENSPQPEGGVIHRDPRNGELTGLLEEAAAMGPVMAQVFGGLDLEASVSSLRAVMADYASKGITTAQDGAAQREVLEFLAYARAQDMLPLRVVAYPAIDVSLAAIEGKYSEPIRGDDYLSLGATKLFSDGSIQGYTGYLGQAYHLQRSGLDAHYRGYPQTRRERLLEQVLAVHRSGRQLAIHGNGDAAIDDILYALEQAQMQAPREDARPVIIHAQMARDDQLAKMAQLGVLPSFFNMHTYYWGDRHRDIFIGPQRAAAISPARSADRHGLRFTFHADTPVVPMSPLRMLWSAVTRQTSSGDVLGPDERISAERALRALTIDAAWQYFMEDERGSLGPGKLADLVVLSDNPLSIAPQQLLDIEILQTVVGGDIVFQGE